VLQIKSTFLFLSRQKRNEKMAKKHPNATKRTTRATRRGSRIQKYGCTGRSSAAAQPSSERSE
jgi:hypothetical protein